MLKFKKLMKIYRQEYWNSITDIFKGKYSTDEGIKIGANYIVACQSINKLYVKVIQGGV